jgi:sugar phosphate isomerase/epimerase
MTVISANMDDFGVDSTTLAGSLEGKLAAARDTGFSHILLASTDLVNHPGGMDCAVAAVQASGLRVSGFQSLNNYEGLSGPLLVNKINVAKALLEMCHALKSHLLVLNASTLATAASDTPTLVRNLRQLAMLAIPKNIRIAYRAHPQAQVVKEFGQAWDLVCMADMPNLGLCLDATEVLTSTSPDNDLDMLDAEKLFFVQLADRLDPTRTGTHLFPGTHSAELATVVTTLHQLGYRGDYGLSAVNTDYLQMPAPLVAQRAWAAALWLGQEVLQRSVPLPNQIRLKHRLSG